MMCRKPMAFVVGLASLATFAVASAGTAKKMKPSDVPPPAAMSNSDQAILVKGNEIRGRLVKTSSSTIWVKQAAGEVVALKVNSDTTFSSPLVKSVQDLKSGQYLRARYLLEDKTTNVATSISLGVPKRAPVAKKPNQLQSMDQSAVAQGESGRESKTTAKQGAECVPNEAEHDLWIKGSEVRGRVIRSSDDAIWIERSSGPVITLKVDSQTTFTGAHLNGAKDLKEGQPIRAIFLTIDKTTNLAIRVHAASPPPPVASS